MPGHTAVDTINHPPVAYSDPPLSSNLERGLQAYQILRAEWEAQEMHPTQLRETDALLRGLGELLYHWLQEHMPQLPAQGPLPLRLSAGPWVAWPWELLHDGHDWLNFRRGVIRLSPPSFAGSATPWEPAAHTAPLRVLSSSAMPLAAAAETETLRRSFDHLRRRCGERPFADAAQLARVDPDPPAKAIDFRALRHMTRSEFTEVLAAAPQLLCFCGFAGEQGWYLESAAHGPQCVPWKWLALRLREAAANGLRMVVLCDSYGLLSLRPAMLRDAALLHAGAPTLVRIAGHVHADRARTYLHALARALAAAQTPHAAHRSALRILHAQDAMNWDWSSFRFQTTRMDAQPPPSHAHRQAATTSSSFSPHAAWQRYWSRKADDVQAPPLLQPRRRFLNRERPLQHLLRLLDAQTLPVARTIQLAGPAGVGKTALAREAVTRLHTRYAEVVWISRQSFFSAAAALAELAPDPRQNAPSESSLPNPNAQEPAPTLPPLHGDAALELALLQQLGEVVSPWASAHTIRRALRRHLQDGQSRLFVLDELATHADASATRELLEQSGDVRSLWIVRAPLWENAPAQMQLEPASLELLVRLHGSAWLQRLRDHSQGAVLLQRCREDLLFARLLARAPRWPNSAQLQHALHESAPATRTRATLLHLLITENLAELSSAERALLPPLWFCPAPLAISTLAHITDLGAPKLRFALERLYHLGWVEAWDANLFAPPAALRNVAHEAILHKRALRSLRFRLAEALKREWSAHAGAAPREWDSLREDWECSPAQPRPPALLHASRRSTLMCLNVSELALWFTHEEDGDALRALSLWALPRLREAGWEDAAEGLRRCLQRNGTRDRHSELHVSLLLEQSETLLQQGEVQHAGALIACTQASIAQGVQDASREQGPCVRWNLLRARSAHLQASWLLHQGQRNEALTQLLRAADEAASAGSGSGLSLLAAQWRILQRENHLSAQEIVAQLRTWLEVLDAARVSSADRSMLCALLADALLDAGEDQAMERLCKSTLATLGEQEHIQRAALWFRQARWHQQHGESLLAWTLWQRAEQHAPQGLPQGWSAIETHAIFGAIAEALPTETETLNALQLLERRLRSAPAAELLSVLWDSIGGVYYRLGQHERATRAYRRKMHWQAETAAQHGRRN